MDSDRLGLDDWFSPHTLPEFVSTVLGRRSLHVPGRPELADRLRKALGIASIDDVFDLRDPEVYAWFPQLDGKTAAAVVLPQSARTFYSGGTTLYVRNVAEFLDIEREFASALGIPRISVNCELFCNRPDALTSMHFDPSDVITIQLTGRKTWRIAPNRFAPTPLEGWAPGKPVPAKMRAYAPGPPPEQMPDDAMTFVLEPGSLLHIPRGYWHETFSDEESMSVHFVIPAPTRLDVVLGALQQELARDERWRRAAYRFDSIDGDALDDLTADYARLREVVARLDPRDVVRAPVREWEIASHGRFQRCGQVSIGVGESSDAAAEPGTVRVSVIAHGFRDNHTTTLELSPQFAAACRWIADLPAGAVFDLDDLRQSVPALSAAQAPTLLAALEKAYLVRPYVAGDDEDDDYSAAAEAERIAAGIDNGGLWI